MIRSQINGTSGYCADMEVNSCLVVTYPLKDRMIMIIFNDPLKCDDHLSSLCAVPTLLALLKLTRLKSLE